MKKYRIHYIRHHANGNGENPRHPWCTRRSFAISAANDDAALADFRTCMPSFDGTQDGGWSEPLRLARIEGRRLICLADLEK